MANDAVQLCNGNTCVQLCNGNTCVQLCTLAAPVCPEDCAACPDPITATVSGLGGGMGCSDLNGVWELTYVGACTWGGGTGMIIVTLACGGGTWQLDVSYLMYSAWARFTVAAYGGCPPAPGWVQTAGTCTGGAASLAW